MHCNGAWRREGKGKWGLVGRGDGGDQKRDSETQKHRGGKKINTRSGIRFHGIAVGFVFQSLSHVRLFCDRMDYIAHPLTTSSSVQGNFQARLLEWVSISFSRGSSRPRDWTCIFCISRWILYQWATWVYIGFYANSKEIYSVSAQWQLQSLNFSPKSHGRWETPPSSSLRFSIFICKVAR